jgi:hypothetical protein
MLEGQEKEMACLMGCLNSYFLVAFHSIYLYNFQPLNFHPILFYKSTCIWSR